ncbi:hypothetical protein OS493_017127 [Desmophyllum pertusum]|uniref:Uncharacterized protein n=1 Tax=Desmophyllum pertusum TaxID=174260 RepID=A0A9W9YCI6_9CNID|nr:hypothetical protein OS493_017127 [Desmophyllum pertusum]
MRFLMSFLGLQEKEEDANGIWKMAVLTNICLTCKEAGFGVNYNKGIVSASVPRLFVLGDKQKFCLRCLASCEECIKVMTVASVSQGPRNLFRDCFPLRLAWQGCPFGYTSHGNPKTGRVCLLNRIT